MCNKELINDERLTPTMERVRSGSMQLFRERNANDRTFISINNCNVAIQHEIKSMYAELIDEKWYWVNGCAECNGKERDWMTYIECEEHDRCRMCSIKKKNLKNKTVWGGKKGWICNDCHDAELLERRKAAFEKFNNDNLHESDFYNTNKILCPHCGSQISNDDVHESQELQCGVCDGEIYVEVEYTVSYSTTIKGNRITK